MDWGMRGVVRPAWIAAALAVLPSAALALVEDAGGPAMMMRVGGKAGPASCWSRPKPCPTSAGEANYCSKPAPCPAGTRTVQAEGGDGEPAIYVATVPPPVVALAGNHDEVKQAIGNAWRSGKCLLVFGRFTRSGAVAAPLLSVDHIVGPCPGRTH